MFFCFHTALIITIVAVKAIISTALQCEGLDWKLRRQTKQQRQQLKKFKPLEIDWASYFKSREAKAQKLQIIRNGFEASVKAKVQKAQIISNRLGLPIANQSLDIDGGHLLQINESQSFFFAPLLRSS